MNSHCIEKLAHECGTKSGLQVFKEGSTYNGYCFACDTYVEHPYADGTKPAETFPPDPGRVQAEIEEAFSLPFLGLPERKLDKDSLEYFGVRTAVSEVDGTTPIVHYYPYTKNDAMTAWKCRFLNSKKMWVMGDFKKVDFFGWDMAKKTGARKLFITEGEIDAISLWQVLVERQKGTKWEEYTPAVVSLPSGSSSAPNIIARNLADINRMFEEIVLVFDMDKPGQEAATNVMKICPRAKVAVLPSKDANQCLIDGRKRALSDAVLFKAVAPKNTRLVWGTELHDKARVQAKMGLSWPWKQLTTMTRGIRFGETYYLGGGVKMGKS